MKRRVGRPRVTSSVWRDGGGAVPCVRIRVGGVSIAVAAGDLRKLSDALHDAADKFEASERAKSAGSINKNGGLSI